MSEERPTSGEHTAAAMQRWAQHKAIEAAEQRVAEERAALPGPDEGHQFHIEVRSQSASKVVGEEHYHDSDWVSGPMTTTVRAWSLRDAMAVAAALPLEGWTFASDEDEGWADTMEIMSEPGALDDLREAEAAAAAGDVATMDDLKADLEEIQARQPEQGVSAERIRALMRMLVNSGDATPMATRLLETILDEDQPAEG